MTSLFVYESLIFDGLFCLAAHVETKEADSDVIYYLSAEQLRFLVDDITKALAEGGRR